MAIDAKVLEESLLRWRGETRLIQDSPILPEVWSAFGEDPGSHIDLLLTPHRDSTPAALAEEIHKRLPSARRDLCYNNSYVVGRFTFRELIGELLPLTKWLKSYVLGYASDETDRQDRRQVELSMAWLVHIAGLIAAGLAGSRRSVRRTAATSTEAPSSDLREAAFNGLIEGTRFRETPAKPLLWLVSLNRQGSLSLWHSRKTVKADVSERSFRCDFTGLRWAIIDTGIDARHPAFRRRDTNGKLQLDKTKTRVLETYDFTRLRTLVSMRPAEKANLTAEQQKALARLKQDVGNGRSVNWDVLAPLLKIEDNNYVPPPHEHGTHVAGILAADWCQADGLDFDPNNANGPEEMLLKNDLQGMCPSLQLYDLRVFSAVDGAMTCDEFVVTSALQFVRHLNNNSDRPKIHGVNLSMSIPAKVESFACGCTPVCEEAERLVHSGVVTVVAAGNAGYRMQIGAQPGEGYQSTTITDPGNAQDVITVGATHREDPHTYGVSYFSSRGPTGDGRAKPDLVAPGEKVVGPIPGAQTKSLDGTSMAAPHVSGAAAMLMARYRELVGQPDEIKRILMETATDLGRERAFQGAGLVDIFRALQSV